MLRIYISGNSDLMLSGLLMSRGLISYPGDIVFLQ